MYIKIGVLTNIQTLKSVDKGRGIWVEKCLTIHLSIVLLQ